jgi:hypothetical protein
MQIKKDDDESSRTNHLRRKLRCAKRDLNLLIDTDLFKRFKAKAAMKEETMTDIITRAIMDYLKN